MRCFKDMTFCPGWVHERCAKANDCHRPLTEKVKQDAIMWWGNDNAPIMMFATDPQCFEPNEDELEEMHRQAEAYAEEVADEQAPTD